MNETEHDRPVRDCLVAVVNSDEDLQRFTGEGTYRIPARAVGRSLSRAGLYEARVLALYQTASIAAGLPSAIELWGDIEHCELLPRREIVPEQEDHPSADELYYRIRVRDSHRFDAPILSRAPRRLLFLRTTRERLYNAADINDLVVGTAEEERLWRALHERVDGAERKMLVRVEGMVMEVDFAFVRNGRTVGVHCRADVPAMYDDSNIPVAWRILRFSPVQLREGFTECLREIEQIVLEPRNPAG